MKALHTLLLTLTLASTPATAWTFTWRNASNIPFIKESTAPQPCTQIEQAQGKEFVFEPGNSPYSFYIWANDNCNGSYSGMTNPSRWGKQASSDLRSYMVNYGDNNGPSTTAVASSSSSSSSTASTTSTSTGTAASGTSTPTSAATPPADDSTSSASSISGGAIAGIVIGVVAGIALVGGAFWLGRRRRGGSAPGAGAGSGPGGAPQGFGSASGMGPGGGYVQPGTPIGGSEASYAGYVSAEVAKPPLGSGGYENLPLSPVPVYQAPTFAELPGESAVVEMSDTQRVNELDGGGKGYR
ncbi:hypothetical protein BBP40_004419 [Aspergillus hancockii]|nr:hypothetical protein BBP40_004419 [Aspergillus hancockii]